MCERLELSGIQREFCVNLDTVPSSADISNKVSLDVLLLVVQKTRENVCEKMEIKY